MQSNDKKKICVVVTSLGKGGAERSAILLVKGFLTLNYDVHLVTMLNTIDYHFEGKLYNLGLLREKDNSLYGKISRFLALKKYLKKHDFDLVIDSRTRSGILREIFMSKVVYSSTKVAYMVRSFNLNPYFVSIKWLARFLYKNAYKIITVSSEIKNEVERKYGFKNVQCIYNPIVFNKTISDTENPLNYRYVLYFGRLINEVKNIKLLIDAYKISHLSKENIKLVILGDGKDEELLKNYVEVHDLTNHIMFYGFTNNPNPYIINAMFTILTSKYEGFPRTLIESLAFGTPVISVNCSSGPMEIIRDEYNGLLVENNNAIALAEAMNKFIFDEALWTRCKSNATDSVKHLSINNIVKEWQHLIK